MAEIKLNDSFSEEVNAFRAAGEGINTDGMSSVSAGELSLPTVEEYKNRIHKIWGLMIRFQCLVKKDADDMDALAAALKAADAS